MSRDGVIQIRGTAAVIENATEAQNTFGEPVPTPATFATVKAFIQPLSGAELFTAQQIFAQVTHRISVTPFVAGVTAKMRVNAGGVIYDIGAPLDVDLQGKVLELLAVRRGA